MRGRKIYEPPSYLTASNAIKQILEVSKRRALKLNNKLSNGGSNGNGIDCDANKDNTIDEETICVALARVGWDSQKIISGKMSTVRDADLGEPIHSLIIPGEMHFLELDMLKLFAVDLSEFKAYSNYSRGGGSAVEF